MGTDRSGTSLRGLLISDPRRAWWDAESGEYAAGVKLSGLQSMSPIAGIPEPSQSGAMGLRASGAQEQALYTLTNRGGLPGTDECGMLWSDTDGSAYRGCDLPNVSTAFEPLPQAGKTLRTPHIKALSNGKLIKAYWSDGVGVEVRVRDPDTLVWGAAVSVHTETTTNPCPALQVQPDGRIHLYAFEELDASTLQIILYYSDDDGATWENAGYVLADSIDLSVYTEYYRIRTGYLNGQMIMMLHLKFITGPPAWGDVLSQWASSDGGHYFSEVYTQDGSDEDNAGASPEIVIDQGVILIGYIRTTLDVTDHVHAEFRRLGTAWYRFDYAPVLGSTFDKAAATFWGDLPATLIVDPFFAFWADDDGSLYCTGVDYSTGAAPIMRSADHAATWIGTGTTARFASLGQCWWDHDSPDDVPVDFSAVSWRGKSVIATGWDRVGAQEDAIGVVYLGGWQTTTMGNRTSIQRPTHRRGWERPGYSTSLPDETGVWTLAGVGPVAINADNYVQMTPAGIQTVLYSVVPTATLQQGLNAEFALQRVAGIGASPRMQLEITTATPEGYGIYVLLTSTHAQLWDLHAGPAMIAEVALPTSGTGFYRIRMALQDDNCRAQVAPHDTSPDTVWTTIGSSTALNDSGANTGNLIEWGLDAAGDAIWAEWHYADDAYTSAATWAAGQAVRSRYPRPVLGSPVWFGLGVSLSADTGPTVVGDEWVVTPTAEYPPENLDPTVEASPRHPWRSRAHADMTGADQLRLAWSLSSVVEYSMGNLWACWIDEANCAGIGVYLYYGGAWHLVKTTGYDTFSASRAGGTVVVNTAGGVTGAHKWRRGELDGAGIESITLPAGTSDWVGKITNNRQGSTFISGAINSMRFAATIEGDNVFLIAAPTVRMWPKRHLVLIDLNSFAQDIRGVQIRITKQPLINPLSPGNPYDGYFEIGKVVFGPVWAWGRDYSWGRSISHEVSHDISTAEDGTRMVRALAPVRRIVEMSWADEVSECQYIDNDLPDYVSFDTATPAIAFYQDTPLDIADEVRQLQGAANLVVYLPMIPRGSTGDYDQWGQGAVYGRITESVSVDTVQGDEGENEAMRLSKLVIEEEL